MAKESRLLFSLDDILAIRFTCQTCGSVQSFSPGKWGKIVCVCCNDTTHEWFKQGSVIGESVTHLRDAIRGLISNDDKEQKKFTIQMEVLEELE